MLTHEENELLTRIGPGTKMGDYLRRYWHPIAGISEFESRDIKPVRLFGENLVLYKDKSGEFGLVARQCAHRRADLAYGMVEDHGLRCNYHGWCFDKHGACTEQPFEDVVRGREAGAGGRGSIRLTAYRVQCHAGMIWAYMGPDPAPLLPDWEPFSWKNGFVQIVLSEVPCNWLQCQENSIDPVHFEWMHEAWAQRLKGQDGPPPPRHLKVDFSEFEYGFRYRRIKEDSDEQHENWSVGRVALWPNCFYLTEHFEWRVPIDDENTLSVTWKYSRVPREQEPYVQERIPTWVGPVFDGKGEWITSHVMNQDFLAWAGQGAITDRSKENLGLSDRGIVLLRRRFFAELEKVAAGGEPKGLIRDPESNVAVELPSWGKRELLEGMTKAQIEANPLHRLLATTYAFQAGQPEEVRAEMAAAMGLEIQDFTSIDLTDALSRKEIR
ncbi:MAG TPA: aromatic ring-hydroxylating dioxygenase subunit alpha [Rhizorhapis sp.]|nr:aromatic ring-hydroxylating dioxygenase subunit alpha [Rhizorhapis sp.]